MTLEDAHTLALHEGDELHCIWDIRHGQADLTVTAPDGTSIYRGNKLDRADFTLPIGHSGEYKVTFTAVDVKGTLLIQREAAEEHESK